MNALTSPLFELGAGLLLAGAALLFLLKGRPLRSAAVQPAAQPSPAEAAAAPSPAAKTPAPAPSPQTPPEPKAQASPSPAAPSANPFSFANAGLTQAANKLAPKPDAAPASPPAPNAPDPALVAAVIALPAAPKPADPRVREAAPEPETKTPEDVTAESATATGAAAATTAAAAEAPDEAKADAPQTPEVAETFEIQVRGWLGAALERSANALPSASVILSNARRFQTAARRDFPAWPEWAQQTLGLFQTLQLLAPDVVADPQARAEAIEIVARQDPKGVLIWPAVGDAFDPERHESSAQSGGKLKSVSRPGITVPGPSSKLAKALVVRG